MIIIWYHVSEIKPYMKETQQLVTQTLSKHYKIIDGLTRIDSEDMGEILKQNWRKDDILIIGQDNVPTLKTIHEMEYCKYLACVNPCISYPASTALDRPMLNQIDDKGKMYSQTERPHFVFYGGTGVSKISKELQNQITLDFNFGFPRFDSELHRVFHEFKQDFHWHSHYPIHKHNKTEIELRHWKK